MPFDAEHYSISKTHQTNSHLLFVLFSILSRAIEQLCHNGILEIVKLTEKV